MNLIYFINCLPGGLFSCVLSTGAFFGTGFGLLGSVSGMGAGAISGPRGPMLRMVGAVAEQGLKY